MSPLSSSNPDHDTMSGDDTISAYTTSASLLHHAASSHIQVFSAGMVRDPLEMVASAYCYHHSGQETSGSVPEGEEEPHDLADVCRAHSSLQTCLESRLLNTFVTKKTNFRMYIV